MPSRCSHLSPPQLLSQRTVDVHIPHRMWNGFQSDYERESLASTAAIMHFY